MAAAKKVSGDSAAKLRFTLDDAQSWCTSQDRNTALVVLASQVVSGLVHVNYYDPSCYHRDDQVQVNLTGTSSMESWISTNASHCDWSRRYDTEQILHMRKTLPLTSEQVIEAPSASHCVDFDFQVCTNKTSDLNLGLAVAVTGQDSAPPKYSPIPFASSGSIPSTSSTNFALPGRVHAGKDGFLKISIQYYLTAVLLRGLSLDPIAQASQEIIILDDNSGLQPPNYIADYPDKCSTFTPAITHPHGMIRKLARKFPNNQDAQGPRIFVNATEPNPLVFQRPITCATTSVPIQLAFLDSPDGEEVTVASNAMTITWQLEQSRFSSLGGLRRIPTCKGMETKNSKIVCKTLLDKKTMYTCQLDKWRYGTMPEHVQRHFLSQPKTSSLERQMTIPGPRSGSLNIEREDPFSHVATRTTTISIPISIPLSPLKQPTSIVSYMEIHYALLIDIYIPVCSTRRRKQETAGQHVLLDQDNSERSSTPKTSWTAKAHLNVPIQLLYQADPSDKRSKQSPPDFPSESTAIPNCDGVVESATRRRQESALEEMLPSYRESTGQMGIAMAWCPVSVGP